MSRNVVALVIGAAATVSVASAGNPLLTNGLRGTSLHTPNTIQKTSSVGPIDQPTETRRLLSSPSSSEYLDCFVDARDDRVMEDKFVTNGMTADVCRQHCIDTDQEHLYYGTQYGKECWCGTSSKLSDYDKHGEGNCNVPCAGDADESCGGAWAFDLFRIDQVESNSVPAPAPDDMVELLDLHNEIRCMHGAGALAYSDTIASTASTYAKKLASSSLCGELEHSERDERNGWGENLFLCGTTDLGYDCYQPDMAMHGFYDEEVGDGAVTTYGGHATQCLWKATKEVGCAVESCIKDGWRYNVLVCNYDPPGNYSGQYEEQVEKPSKSKTQCGYPEYQG